MPHEGPHIARHDPIGEGQAQARTFIRNPDQQTSSRRAFWNTYFILENKPILQEPRFLNTIPGLRVICSFVDLLRGFSEPTEHLLDLTVRFGTINHRGVLMKIRE